MKTIKLDFLRIAVIPTGTANNIDQNSSVNDIRNCAETVWYTVGEYCQAQNDEDMDFLHWTFLINTETWEDLTGI